MSLIMSFETYQGIVMTADRMSTVSYYNEKSNTTDAFTKTSNARKLFITKNGYGLSFCGNGKISNDLLLEEYILSHICNEDFDNASPTDIAKHILTLIKNEDKDMDTILLICGYYNDTSFAIEINIKKEEIYEYPDASKNKVIRYGDSGIANALLSGEFYYGYNTYRLQDGVELLITTNKVTAQYQHFQEVLPSVSEECDVLILYRDRIHKWLSKNDLHI